MRTALHIILLVSILIPKTVLAYPKPQDTVFKESELQLDIYGIGNYHKGSRGDYIKRLSESLGGPEFGLTTQISGRPGWGMGVGITKISGKYLGLGLEQATFGRVSGSQKLLEADFGYWRWQTSGHILVRYPIEKLRLCPYILVGGGSQYGNKPNINLSKYTGQKTEYKLSGQGFGQVGGGLEYRLIKNTSLYTDLRYLFSAVQGLPTSQIQWRWGIRQIF